MHDENEAAQAEGEALPLPDAEPMPPPLPSPPPGGFFSPVESLDSRVEAAIERWYAEHFHRAAVDGRAPLTADDKAALISSVRSAVAQPEE